MRTLARPRHHERVDDQTLLLHAGLGTGVDLAPNVYLRPEVLARWDGDDSDAVVGNVNLGIGWRF